MIPLQDDHRRATSQEQAILLLKPPFSFFDFIENRFGDYDSVRRIFSLARSFYAESLIIEMIPPIGIIAEENDDIFESYPDYHNPDLLRLSFWKTPISVKGPYSLTSDNLIGYAILKHDEIPSISYDRWHVFEAVLIKYHHEHNFVPRPGNYRIVVDDTPLEIKGLLYCQQNGINKACAQVALRSLLSRILPEGDISYRRMNQIAAKINPGFKPNEGLSVPQIREILKELGIIYNDIDYTQEDKKLRDELPYQKYAYSGLESGQGALVGFRLAGRELREEAAHIIPFYGHTFNKDTWAPNADVSYFHIGEGVGYVPSESWTSSFIGHDDNFGPNFCIPRLYMERDKVDYVVELFRPGVVYGGMKAEAVALNIIYSIWPSLESGKNKWVSRLFHWVKKQQVVFRAQAMTSTEYVTHLLSLEDWDGKKENPRLCKLLEKELPDYLWAVEISTPQLFPANERKIGEIVLDATQPTINDEATVFNIFILARLPGIYLFGGDIRNGIPQFTKLSSRIESHTTLIKL
jgi:hypothetical protein